MPQPLSVPQHRQQQFFKNSQPWWTHLMPTEQLFTESMEAIIDSPGEEDENFSLLAVSPSGGMVRRLPDLSETEGDERYFDS